MRIKKLFLKNFRNISHATFEASESINFFTGSNGSGKSSLLEAIHLLSNGRSFRTHITADLIKKGTSELLVRSEFSGTSAGQHSIGYLKHADGGLQLRLDKKDVKSTSEVARIFPVRTIHPEMHELVRGGPAHRRKFVDWGVFHVEQQFHIFWKRYVYALKNRNLLLKQRTVSKLEILAWDKELGHSGTQIDHLRSQYLGELEEIFEKWMSFFLIREKVSLTFYRGWESDLLLSEALEISLEKCLRYRTSSIGPHRADLRIKFDGYPAKHIVSRGQQKLLVYALVFAQIELHHKKTKEFPVLLCDDLEAELDKKHRSILLEAIRLLRIQTFITGSGENILTATPGDKIFVLEQGHIINQI